MKYFDYILIDEVKDMNMNRGYFYSDDTSYENLHALNDTTRFLETHFSLYNSNLLYLALTDLYHLIYDSKSKAKYTLIDGALKTIYFEKTKSADDVYGEIHEPEELENSIGEEGMIKVVYDQNDYVSKEYLFDENQLVLKANINGNLYLKKATLVGDDIYYRVYRKVNGKKNMFVFECFDKQGLLQDDLKQYILNTVSEQDINDFKILFPEAFENIKLNNKTSFARVNKR